MHAFKCMIALGCAASILSGCYAGVRGGEVVIGDGTSEKPGLRYYLTAPYFIVEQLPDQRWTARMELGVDRSRTYAIQPYTVLAASTATVEFNPDGTLKSFKLDQDTTKVPEAVVNALKDIQLKRLALEQSALDEKLTEAQKAGETKAAAGLLRPAPEGAPPEAPAPQEMRRVFVYKVNGTQLQKPGATPTLSVPPTASTPEARTGLVRPPGSSDLRLTVSGQKAVLEKGDDGLSQADIARLAFFKANGDPLEDAATAALRSKFSVVQRRLEIPVQTLRDAAVARIGLGRSEVTVR